MTNETNNPHDDGLPLADQADVGGNPHPGPSDPGPEQAAHEQEDLVTQLRTDLADMQQQALRAQAELENFRKRVYRQMDDERKYASLPVLRDLLPVIDNLQRAVAAAEQSHNSDALLGGVQLVLQQIHGVLQTHHCTAMDAKGRLFDPHVHEAIAQIPHSEYPPGTVAEVTQTGYQLHDRIVRPAQVLVSTRPVASSANENSAEAETET